MASTNGYRIAVVNPLTLVGNEIKMILHQRGLTFAEIHLLDSTGTNTGAISEVEEEARVVTAISEIELSGMNVVFFCGDGGANEPWIRKAEELGFLAIDLSQPSALANEAEAIIAGINIERIHEGGQVALSPHPFAVPITLVLSQIRKLSPIRIATASIFQSASDFDQAGIDELFQQTIKALNMESIPKTVFDRQLAFNYYPAVGASTSEPYVIRQVRTFLPDVPLTISVSQGTTFHGHTFSLFVQTEKELDPESLRAKLDESGGIDIAIADDDLTSTIDAAGKDAIQIGRIQKDPNIAGGFWLWIVSDNLRRSSALNAVLIAEEYLSRFAN